METSQRHYRSPKQLSKHPPPPNTHSLWMLKICFAFRTVKHSTSTQLKLDNVPLKSSYTRLHGGMHPCKEPLRLSPLFSTLLEPGCPQQLPCHQSNEAPHSPCFNPNQKGQREESRNHPPCFCLIPQHPLPLALPPTLYPHAACSLATSLAAR